MKFYDVVVTYMAPMQMVITIEAESVSNAEKLVRENFFEELTEAEIESITPATINIDYQTEGYLN